MSTLLYNPDRWKVFSIDKHSVGPMGILELAEKYQSDPRIGSMVRTGNLVKLDSADVIQHGEMLLRRFEKGGCRGSVVVSRTYAFGDILLAATVLELLVRKYPGNEIIFHTTAQHEPLVRHYPNVSIITGADSLRKALKTAGVYLNLDDIPERFEEYHPGSGMNRIEIFSNYLGMVPDSLCPKYYIDQSELDSGANYLKQYDRPYIAISPSTMRKEKSWRPEKWKEFAFDIVQKTQGTVFVLDSEDILDCKHPKIVPVIGRMFRTVGGIVWHMDVIVTQDSLWSHWAAALGVPQVLLSSCTDGQLMAKGYSNVTVIQRDWECVPCWYRFNADDCIYGNYPRCLDDVKIDEVSEKVMEAL